MYDEHGALLEYRFWRGNPDVVLVDTRVIAQAPVRFRVVGIGDGLSTWFEADASSTTRAIVAADLYGHERRGLRERTRPLPAAAS